MKIFVKWFDWGRCDIEFIISVLEERLENEFWLVSLGFLDYKV